MKKGKELRRMKEGEIFGEMSFLGSFNTSAQVVAMTTCYVSQIEPNFLNSLFSAGIYLFSFFLFHLLMIIFFEYFLLLAIK